MKLDLLVGDGLLAREGEVFGEVPLFALFFLYRALPAASYIAEERRLEEFYSFQ